MRVRLTLAFSVCFSLVSSYVYAQANVGQPKLDITYGSSGTTELDLPGQGSKATCYIIQKSTPAYIGGVQEIGGVAQLVVAKFDQNGHLEPGFGTGGLTTASWGESYPNQLLLEPDGRIVVAGWVTQFSERAAAVFRFLSNGTPDLTFGTDGHVVLSTPLGTVAECTRIDTLSIDGARRYVCVNYVQNGGMGVVRLNNDGSSDWTFGLGGSVYVQGSVRYATGNLTNAHGIRMAGINLVGNVILLASITPGGAIDPNFGGGGPINTGIVVQAAGANKLFSAIQNDSLIVLAETEPSSSVHPFTLTRFDSAGAVDTSYGIHGQTDVDAVVDLDANGLYQSNDGSLIVAGMIDTNSTIHTPKTPAAVKFFRTGKIDQTFGVNGFATFDPLGGGRHAMYIAFGAIGNRRFYGIGNAIADDGKKSFLVSRYTSNQASVKTETSPMISLESYPNPIQSSVHVSSSSPMQSVAVTDHVGRRVRTVTLSGDESATIDVSMLSSGTYQLTATTAAGIATSRVLITH